MAEYEPEIELNAGEEEQERKILREFAFKEKVSDGAGEIEEEKLAVIRYANKKDEKGIEDVILDRWEQREKEFPEWYKRPEEGIAASRKSGGDLWILEKSFLEPNRYKFFVATVDDKVIAYISFNREDNEPNTTHIDTISVMRPYQKRKGFGKNLLECAEKSAQSDFKAKKIWANVIQKIDYAIEFWIGKDGKGGQGYIKETESADGHTMKVVKILDLSSTENKK